MSITSPGLASSRRSCSVAANAPSAAATSGPCGACFWQPAANTLNVAAIAKVMLRCMNPLPIRLQMVECSLGFRKYSREGQERHTWGGKADKLEGASMHRKSGNGDRLSIANVPTNMLCGLLLLAAEYNVNSESWLAGQRLSVEQLNDPLTRISYRQAIEVIRRALPTLPIDDVGLAMGGNQNGGNFGLLGL